MPKWKFVRNFYKSKTPLNTPLSTWFFFVGYAFFWCFICILNIFEKKKIFKKKFFRRQFWRQFSVWRQFFLTSNAQKFPKVEFLERAPKKTQKNGVDAQNWRIISKVMAKWRFWVVDVSFWRQFRSKSQKIELSQAKRLSYLLELFCWHILLGFKKNPRNGFSAKSQKLPKMAKNGFFSHKWAVFEKTGQNLKKAAVLRFLHFLPPTSCRVSEKSSERFLR